MKLKFITWRTRKKLQRSIMKKYNNNHKRLRRHIKKIIMTDDLTEETVSFIQNEYLRFQTTFEIIQLKGE